MSPTSSQKEAGASEDTLVACLGPPGNDLGDQLGAEFRIDRYTALEALLEGGRREQPRLCIIEPSAEDPEGRDVANIVRRVRRELPLTDALVWAPKAEAELVRQALLAGACDVLAHGDSRRLGLRVRKVIDDQTLLPRMLEEDRRGGTWRFEGLISRSQKMWDIFETCIRTAGTDASVLILGETGTGKELVARAIHKRSGRSGRFVPLNCGAVPDTLIDSELFGHVEGAFTGARKAKDGLFRHADQGTLFLDEIGDIPAGAQNTLLRTLQEGVVRPLGGHDEISVDVRVVAATSAPLEEEIEEQRFREDLFYRLDVIRLILPPLRERPEDLIFLLGRFTHQLAEDYYVRRPEVGEDFLTCVCEYDWPGNVRELENFVERLVLTHPGERLTEEHFVGLMRTYRRGGRATEEDEPAPPARRIDLARPLNEVVLETVQDTERRYVEEALRTSGGRVGEAARLAGVHRRTLLRKLNQYGIDKTAFRRGPST